MVKDIMEEVMHIHSEGFIHRYLNPNAIYLIEQHKTIIHQILLAGKTLVVPNTMADNNALLPPASAISLEASHLIRKLKIRDPQLR